MNPPTKTKEKQKTKSQSDDSIPSFIRKTYEILEEGKHADVIRWSDDGTALVIVNPTEFAQKVLPTYFKHNNLTSFIRQLNMYDFHKKRSLNMDHVYCHDLFQRGKKNLLKEIHRKNSESVTSGAEKTLPMFESTQTKQDLAAVVHENVLMKKYNQDTLNRVSLVETQLKEKNIENQTLWRQIFQLREKEELLKSVIVNFMKQNGLPLTSLPPVLQSEFDYTTFNFKSSTEQKDNSPTFLAQTTTKMHFPSPNMTFPQSYQNPQQDLQKDMRVNSLQGEKDFTIGNNNQSLYFENLKGKINESQLQGGLGDNRYSAQNFGTNFATQAIDPWGFNFGNLKTLATANDRLNTAKPFGDGSNNIDLSNLAKRKLNDQEDGSNYHKKFKQNPSVLNDGNFKMKAYNKEETENFDNQYMQFNLGSLGNNALLNVKDEGAQKKKNS